LGSANLTTATPGYIPLVWNQFAGFLLDIPSSFAKDVQTEDQTGREWQSAVYVRDRWNVTQNLTFNLGLRTEFYPLMGGRIAASSVSTTTPTPS
jgi:outer membrane receptor protein involved in Fe transport